MIIIRWKKKCFAAVWVTNSHTATDFQRKLYDLFFLHSDFIDDSIDVSKRPKTSPNCGDPHPQHKYKLRTFVFTCFLMDKIAVTQLYIVMTKCS